MKEEILVDSVTLYNYKLIVEFMGAEVLQNKTRKRDKITKYYRGWDEVYWKDHNNIPVPCHDGMTLEKMKFNESWDWIMPVCQKIDKIPDHESYNENRFRMKSTLLMMINYFVYEHAVAFIKNYNKVNESVTK